MQNKSFCEDLTEGKFSFPIIHSILSTPNDGKLLSILLYICTDTRHPLLLLLEILKQKTEDIELKKYALTIMEKTGSFEYTKKVLAECEVKIREELQKLGGNKMLEGLMDQLSKADA